MSSQENLKNGEEVPIVKFTVKEMFNHLNKKLETYRLEVKGLYEALDNRVLELERQASAVTAVDSYRKWFIGVIIFGFLAVAVAVASLVEQRFQTQAKQQNNTQSQQSK